MSVAVVMIIIISSNIIIIIITLTPTTPADPMPRPSFWPPSCPPSASAGVSPLAVPGPPQRRRGHVTQPYVTVTCVTHPGPFHHWYLQSVMIRVFRWYT
jgi:hypothetical protein